MGSRMPKQSVQSWLREKERNPVTPARNVVYVAAPPDIQSDARFIQTWEVPCGAPSREAHFTRPVIEYLSAYFHGMPVRAYKPVLQFGLWDDEKPDTSPKYIGLSADTSTERVGIRCRKCPDGAFKRQLNVSDLVDALIDLLPGDAYSLVLLVNHDIYENDDDDSMCGRAYGGSRAAVVSTARYNPFFSTYDLQHAWPASHCQAYMESLLPAEKRAKSREGSIIDLTQDTPLHRAVEAFRATQQPANSDNADNGLWLSRICRTTSHELGHCFGMDHCVYYACNMQGTAGMSEDFRQPPYLCPVDLAKLLLATGASEKERYGALLAYCERLKHVPMFTAYAAWIRALD